MSYEMFQLSYSLSTHAPAEAWESSEVPLSLGSWGRSFQIYNMLRSSPIYLGRGVARNLLTGDKTPGLGDESPPAGSREEPRWGLEANPPEAGDKC